MTALPLVLLLGFATQETPTQDPLADRIEAYLAPCLADGQISGTVLVARGEAVLFERAYGLANQEHLAPNRVDTPHGIASVTKSMTAVITVRLAEAERLSLEDPIEYWLPEFPRADRITVGHLLRHQAGIPHRVTSELEECVPRSAADMVELARTALSSEEAFLCEPGAESHYSSAGYSVLARVLEVAAGEDYAELLAKHVCAPAGMQHTVHLTHRDVHPGRAQGYMPVAGGVRAAPLKDSSFLVGAGSAYSTARDLMRFTQAIRSGTYGPAVLEILLDQGSFSANGVGTGCRAFVDYDVASDLTIAVTANLTTGALDLLRDALPRLASGEPVEPPARLELRQIAVAPSALERYAGVYQPRPGSTFTVRVEAGGLMIGSYILVPTGRHRFFSFQDYGEVTFELDDRGRATGLDWSGFAMRRVEGL